MSEVVNLLDFDVVEPVEVKLAGRSFWLRPQSAKTIQTVLEFSSVDTERNIIEREEGENADPRRFVRDVFSNWADSVSATVLMLGAAPEDRVFLDENLSPRHVIGIFERWWALNEIDAFFERGGRALMSLTTLPLIRELRQARVTAALEALATEVEAELTPTATPPPAS